MLIMLLALFLVTMFLGTPIAFSMSFASIVTNLTHGASSLMLTAQQCYDSTSNLSLLAVPFFMLAGSIMARQAAWVLLFRPAFPWLFMPRLRAARWGLCSARASFPVLCWALP